MNTREVGSRWRRHSGVLVEARTNVPQRLGEHERVRLMAAVLTVRQARAMWAAAAPRETREALEVGLAEGPVAGGAGGNACQWMAMNGNVNPLSV